MVGDVLFVNKFLFGAKIPFVNAHLPTMREPRHGDIVVFISPIEDSILVKRLIGLPGDTLQMRHGVLHLTGGTLALLACSGMAANTLLDLTRNAAIASDGSDTVDMPWSRTARLPVAAAGPVMIGARGLRDDRDPRPARLAARRSRS